MLPRRRFEPMPTNNQCLSEAKNSKSPTTCTLTPRPWYYIVNRVIKGMSFKPVK